MTTDYVTYYTEGSNIVDYELCSRFKKDSISVRCALPAKTFDVDTASYASGPYRVGRQNKEIWKYYFLGEIKCLPSDYFDEITDFVQALFKHIR